MFCIDVDPTSQILVLGGRSYHPAAAVPCKANLLQGNLSCQKACAAALARKWIDMFVVISFRQLHFDPRFTRDRFESADATRDAIAVDRDSAFTISVTLAATDTQREEIGNYNNTKRGSRCSLL
jgi:hypothetical protein